MHNPRTQARGPLSPPWLERPWDSSLPPLVGLHNEILRFCDLVSPTEFEKSQRDKALGDVKKVLFECFPGCKVHVFGSELTGLCLPSSDLDIACLGIAAGGHGRGRGQSSPLHVFADALRRSGLVSQLEVVESAKVPIVKLVHAATQVAGDVSFDVPDGLQTGWFMRDALDAHPPLRPLLILLKYFLLQRGLNETYPTGGVGSFLLQLMALSYCQHRKLAASSAAAALGAADSYPGESNLGLLLVGFLEFYGRKLNLEAVGISVRGTGSYFRRSTDRRNWVGGPPRNPGLLCMENPFLPDVDVGKNAFNFPNVRRAMCHGHMVLVEALLAQQEVRDARQGEGGAQLAPGGGSASSSSSSSLAPSTSSPSVHSFSHPPSTEELAVAAALPPASALGAIIHCDAVILERELPPRPAEGTTQGLFTAALPPPPQPREGEGSDGESSGSSDDGSDGEFYGGHRESTSSAGLSKSAIKKQAKKAARKDMEARKKEATKAKKASKKAPASAPQPVYVVDDGSDEGNSGDPPKKKKKKKKMQVL